MPLVAGLVVDTAALGFTTVALVRIAEQLIGEKYRWLPFALFITSPAAIFLHLFYAEGVFCALAFWAYLFALRRQWAAMAITLGLLSSVKVTAVLVIGLCVFEFIRSEDWKVRKVVRNPRVLWFLAAPAGFVCYAAYMWWLRGDWLAMYHGYHATTDWSYQIFNPDFMRPILSATKSSLLLIIGKNHYISNTLVNETLPLCGLALVGVFSLYIIKYVRGKFLPLGIMGLLSIVFLSINDNLISVHRYLLPSVILYVIPVFFITTRRRLLPLIYVVMAGGVLLQGFLLLLFISDRFAG